jgi:hypothetical protein
MKMSLSEFHEQCARDGVPRSEYEVVPGVYADTIATMPPSGEPTNIALAFIDCDMYSSTRDVLGFLMPRLKHGMIIAFDDYFCWSSSRLSGERQAMLEAFRAQQEWTLLPYMQFGWHGQSFVVEESSLL